jgi:uncharacterized membrane protein YvbJ
MTHLLDEITIKLNFHFTDIQEVDESLTNDEARQVLQLIADLDNSFIDKETIEAWIKYFKSI